MNNRKIQTSAITRNCMPGVDYENPGRELAGVLVMWKKPTNATIILTVNGIVIHTQEVKGAARTVVEIPKIPVPFAGMVMFRHGFVIEKLWIRLVYSSKPDSLADIAWCFGKFNPEIPHQRRQDALFGLHDFRANLEKPRLQRTTLPHVVHRPYGKDNVVQLHEVSLVSRM